MTDAARPASLKPAPKAATTRDYARRVDRVVRHIADNLDAPLALDRLAAVAPFSPFHLHRIYRALTGETIAETVRRLRMTRAAGALVQTRAPIARVARDAGYGSVPAFARAFRDFHGVPPAAYRRAGRLALPDPRSTPEESMYQAAIRDFAPIRLAAIRHRGPYMEIGTTFERLNAWAAGRGLGGPGTRFLGIYWDDPAAVPAAQLRSDAGMTAPAGFAGDGDVRVVELAGGRIAVARHQGPYAELEAAYRWLYREWLPTSGEEPDDRPCFEEYLNDCRTRPPAEWLTDVCLPLATRR